MYGRGAEQAGGCGMDSIAFPGRKGAVGWLRERWLTPARWVGLLGLVLLLGNGGAGYTRAVTVAEPATLSSPASAEKPGSGVFGSYKLALAIGEVLLLVGLALASLILVLDRRRLHAERDKLQVHVTELNHDKQQLDARLDRQRQHEERLRERERRFRMLVRSAPVGIFLTDAEGNCLYVNDCWCQLTGLTSEQAVGSGWFQALHPDDHDRVLQAWRLAVEACSEFVAEHRFQSASGRIAWLNTRAVPLRSREGRLNGYLGANADIADLKRAEETLRASEARFRNYFELPLVGIALTGPDKRWLEVNDRLCEMLGYSRAELRQLSWAGLTHPDDLDAEVAQFERVISRRVDGYSFDKRFIRKDGAILYASISCRCVRRSNGMVDYFVTVLQDISERRQAEEQIRYLSCHDMLTGLSNRVLFADRLEQAVRRASRDHSLVGVMLVDLDRFKMINDALGHALGDRLLQEVAAQLLNCVRQCDTVCRQGGDEFTVLLPELSSPEEAARVAQRILEAVARFYHIEGHELHASCSIGISLHPRDGNSAESLLKNADVALYRAKDQGRNNYQFYQSGATLFSHERLNLEVSLRHAMERAQMVLYYQPKWDFRANAVTSAEALVRWNHPDKGLVPPARFIPIAEDSGLVLSLGEWVMREAVCQIGELHRSGFPGLRVAVNLSGRQFQQANLVDMVHGLLAETSFDPECLELELTESILMQNTEHNIMTLKALKTLGVRIAIDDFGTGYSSLGYLKRFPVDVLKIDRAFVSDIPASSSNAAIVDAIVTLAHGLDLKVVAEGVETAEQAVFLRAYDCDEGQGFYFGHPLPLAEFRAALVQDRLRAAATTAPPAG